MGTVKNRKYRIAIDGHVLLQEKKTGVGQTAQYLIEELVKDRSIEVQINFVDFLGYRCHRLIKHYRKQGCRIKFCWWLPYSVYVNLFEVFKIPYFFLFGKKNDITLFFEYRVPYKVGTKVADYIYDVNYKVYPETVDQLTLKWLNENLILYCDRADIIITISEFSKKEIVKYLDIDSSKIYVVPCGVDYQKCSKPIEQDQTDAVKKKYGIEGGYILYMGTLEPRKNITLLIEAYDTLIKKTNSLPKLVIAGKKGWMYDQLFQLTSDFDLSNQIIFTGYIDDDDRPALMSNAELFVFPSLYEGFGIPPLEAMACGTPVVISDIDALLEAVGSNAVFFRSMDVEDLGSKINWLLANESIRKKMSIVGKGWAKEHTWEKSGEKLVAVLKTWKEND